MAIGLDGAAVERNRATEERSSADSAWPWLRINPLVNDATIRSAGNALRICFDGARAAPSWQLAQCCAYNAPPSCAAAGMAAPTTTSRTNVRNGMNPGLPARGLYVEDQRAALGALLRASAPALRADGVSPLPRPPRCLKREIPMPMNADARYV